MFTNCNNTDSLREVPTKTLTLIEKQKYGGGNNELLRKICICFLLALVCVMLHSCTAMEFADAYNEGRSYYNAGVEDFKRGDIDDALYNFDQAKEHLDWALVNYDFCIDDVSSSYSSLQEMSALTKMWCGIIYNQQNQHEKAIKEFSGALSYDKLSSQQRATIIGIRGNSHFALGNRTNATEDYHKALKLDPKNDVVVSLGDSLGF